jgi:bacteriocin-like protein
MTTPEKPEPESKPELKPDPPTGAAADPAASQAELPAGDELSEDELSEDELSEDELSEDELNKIVGGYTVTKPRSPPPPPPPPPAPPV